MDLERARLMGALELKRTDAFALKFQLETLAGSIHEMTDLLLLKPEEIKADELAVAARKFKELQEKYSELLVDIARLRQRLG